MIHGIGRTMAALLQVRLRAEAAAPFATQAAGEIVRGEMAARAPRDTGNLVSLIDTEVDASGGGATTRVGSSAEYDRFVQFGTRYMAANPYGAQAAEAAAPGVVAEMIPIFKAAVEL
jgi:HK97 gp10 family phage protein